MLGMGTSSRLLGHQSDAGRVFAITGLGSRRPGSVTAEPPVKTRVARVVGVNVRELCRTHMLGKSRVGNCGRNRLPSGTVELRHGSSARQEGAR